MKPAEEIMADYLLKGGKMLSKTCPKCGSPLFEYQDEEMCVVCKEREEAKSTVNASTAPSTAEAIGPSGKTEQKSAGYPQQPLADEIESTICWLCKRVQEEQRPEDCRILMECIKIGMEALRGL